MWRSGRRRAKPSPSPAGPPRIIDPNTEGYFEVWSRAIGHGFDLAAQEIGSIVERSVGVGGMAGVEGLTGEEAYDLFTRMLVDLEEKIAQYVGKYTADVWLLQSRRHMLCDLFARPPEDDYDVHGRLSIYQSLPRAVALFAAEGNTILPSGSGASYYMIDVADELPVDVQVVVSLLDWYRRCQQSRRRIAQGGNVVVDRSAWPGLEFPGADLPAELAKHLPILQVKEDRASYPMLANLGLEVSTMVLTENDDDRLLFFGSAKFLDFFVAGVRRYDRITSGAEAVSDVRVFARLWMDARNLLEALEFIHDEIVQVWDMSPLEIVSGATVLCLFVRNTWSKDGTRLAFDRTLAARAVFTLDEGFAEEYLTAGLPVVTEALGGHLAADEVAAAVKKTIRQFVEVPRREPARHEGMQLRMYGPFPFLLRAGDKLVLDLYSLPLAFSSIVDSVPLTGAGVQKKGAWFEDRVRQIITTADETISSIGTLEREFREGRTVVGEADVVIRVADTAFVIECKSRRYNKTDDCVTLEEALLRNRDVVAWATQARRIAAYIADHPHGVNHDVPAGVDWIVPIVCTPMLEAAWHQPDVTYLIPDELMITMTPVEILEFVRGGRWRAEGARSWQYPVKAG